ncbi:MAG TPA: protein phosphatase 2C domain-containing protein [Blastocatellia bacterium]|nr:protein phosphatase 2C domain-containing protein [Blastocatellia bacterium]
MSAGRDVTAWVYGCTDVGLVRKSNEDAFVIADLATKSAAASHIPETTDAVPDEFTMRGEEAVVGRRVIGPQGLFLAVSDGMGGAEAGEIASFLVIESLRGNLAEPGDKSTGKLVRAAVERANEVVFEAAEKHAHRSGMGATLSAVFVRENRAYVCGVGDSRCYVIRGGRIRQITRDQSLVESLVELGHITREQAETSPHKNIILQALGTKRDVAVALNRLALRRGDMLLLCSDGLSGKVGAEEMLTLALDGPTIEVACRRMVTLAKERGGEDNITLILAHFSGSGLEQAEDETVTGALEKIHGFNHAAGIGYDDDGEETQPLDTKTRDTAKMAPPPGDDDASR